LKRRGAWRDVNGPQSGFRRPPESLIYEVEPEREAIRVRPVGSLDMAPTPNLRAQVEELRDAGFRSLIVDARWSSSIQPACG
jgi:hypothetical protein